ncbi:hypothetical protein FOZ61_006477 [Perkinsus olseni]|uniref:Uncharacterized protein n=1 Tax=Perkinsus olseni TaxID=32597 RepID=A0A7J6MBM2_PEROL|nr:hypothetical protein FOZ61_006477 [Perkinsus olseni]
MARRSGAGGAAAGAEPVRALTYYESPHKKGAMVTVLVPGYMAKVEKTVPLVNKGDVLQAYRGLPTNAKQELLTIVDADLVSRINEIDMNAKKEDLRVIRQHPKPKRLVGLSAFYAFNSTKLMQGILDSSGVQALAHDRSVKPDVMQPKYHTVLGDTLLPFIQERCEDFLSNTKRMRSRIVRRTELWYRLTDFATSDPRHVVVDGIVAQAVEFRILSEYYKDKFASLRSKYEEASPTPGKEAQRKSNGSVSTDFEDQQQQRSRTAQSKKKPKPKTAPAKRPPAAILESKNGATLPSVSAKSEPSAARRARSKSRTSSSSSTSRSSSSSSTSSSSSSSSSSSIASFLFNVMMTSDESSSETSLSSMLSDLESDVRGFGAPTLPLRPQCRGPPMKTSEGREAAQGGGWHTVKKSRAKKGSVSNASEGPKVSALMSPRRAARRQAAAKAAAAEASRATAAATAAPPPSQMTRPEKAAAVPESGKSHEPRHVKPGYPEEMLTVKRTFIHIDEEPADECLRYHPSMLPKEAPF